MLMHRVALGVIAFVVGAGSPCFAEDSWKVTNRGRGGSYIVRLRPASNRKAGFAISEMVKPGETKTIALSYQGSFDVNIQFLNTDGSVKNSWTADQPVDLRRRTYPATGDNLMDVAMQEPPTKGPDGKMKMGAAKWMPMVSGMRFSEPAHQLFEVGAVSTQDPRNPKLDFNGGVTVGEKVINFQVSGPPREPLLLIGGEPYKIADLVVSRGPEQSRVVVSGAYSGGGRTGEFLLERRDGFPFYRLNLDLKAQGASDWTSFQLGSAAVASEVKRGQGVGIDEVRDVVFELQQPLKMGQDRVEQRMAAMETTLIGRLAELELRLADPKVLRIVKACVECHRNEPAAKAPRNLSALLANIPKMTAKTTKEMIERSELDEQDKARFVEYAKELVKSFGS